MIKKSTLLGLILSLTLPSLTLAENQKPDNRKAIGLAFGTIATACYALAAQAGLNVFVRYKYMTPQTKGVAQAMKIHRLSMASGIITGAVLLGCGALATVAAIKLLKKPKIETKA